MKSASNARSKKYPPAQSSLEFQSKYRGTRWVRLPEPPPNRLTHHRERWSDAEDVTLCEYYTSHGSAYTAAILGRTIRAIVSRAIMLGIPGFETNIWEHSEIQAAHKLFKKKRPCDGTAKAIATSLGRTKASVAQQLHRQGLKVTERLRPWTEDEIKILRTHYGKETVEEIGRRIGRTGASVMGYAYILGLKRRKPPRPWTEQEENELVKLRDEKMDARAIAGRVQRTKADIVTHLRELKLTRQTRLWTAAEDHLLRKLQPDMTYAEIARRLNRTVDAVRAHTYDLGLNVRTKRPWTAHEDAEIRKYYGIMKCSDLGKILDRTTVAVGLRAGKLGLTEERPKQWTAEEDHELTKLSKTGVAIQEIARQLGRTEVAINVRSIRLGLRKREQY